jgi:acyl-CoA reductase-like NAD-dependent aldehyde dehydrogenase
MAVARCCSAFEEIIDVAQVSRYYARTASGYLRPHRRAGALPGLTRTWEYHHPKRPGRCDLTVELSADARHSDALPALVAGNAVIAKPDKQTPYSLLWAAELLEEAGLPSGVLQVVTGSADDLGASVIELSDFLMFTGSTRVGRIVTAQGAERLIDYSMERMYVDEAIWNEFVPRFVAALTRLSSRMAPRAGPAVAWSTRGQCRRRSPGRPMQSQAWT